MTSRHQRPLGRRRLLFALGGAAVAVPVAATVAPYALVPVRRWTSPSNNGRTGRKTTAVRV
ncbi:glycosyl hydrolase, partial [Streptomyces chartreusis]